MPFSRPSGVRLARAVVEGINACGMHQPEDGKQRECLRETAGQAGSERSVMMRQERTDTNHLGTELFYEKNVFHQVVDSLSWTSHHDAGSRLESDAFQIVQTTQTVGQ